MTARCPSDLALELFLLSPARSEETGHVEGCPACAARLARMREEGEEFRRIVFPQTIDAVERAATRRRFSFSLRWVAALAPVAAALLAVVLFRSDIHELFEDEYADGVKGSGITLAVFANGTGDGCAVSEGTKVHADSTLWFKIQPATGCWLWLMSVDGRGQVSRLYPPEGAAPELRQTGQVPVGAKLDGVPGPERIYAVCAPSAQTPWSEVRAAAEGATRGPEALREARNLGGDLARAVQASVLLEKQPAAKP